MEHILCNIIQWKKNPNLSLGFPDIKAKWQSTPILKKKCALQSTNFSGQYVSCFAHSKNMEPKDWNENAGLKLIRHLIVIHKGWWENRQHQQAAGLWHLTVRSLTKYKIFNPFHMHKKPHPPLKKVNNIDSDRWDPPDFLLHQVTLLQDACYCSITSPTK